MSLIIPACCCYETGCIFPEIVPGYTYRPRGNGEKGICARSYWLGDCCVYDAFGYKVKCIEGISASTCENEIITGSTTVSFSAGINRGTGVRCSLEPRIGTCKKYIEGVQFICRDGPDTETERDVCCEGRPNQAGSTFCTNPNDITKHIFWLSYDGEETYTQAGGYTATRHEIAVQINYSYFPDGRIFRGKDGTGGPVAAYNNWNGYGCNIVNGIYKETWTNRLDKNYRTDIDDPENRGYLKYGTSVFTTPTEHSGYDAIYLDLQNYVDSRNNQFGAYKTETQDIKAQWKINRISWLWYNSSSNEYKFDPPCVSWTSTTNRSFTGKYGRVYTLTLPPTPGISSDCDQGCCCNNILPVLPGEIGCECRDTCGSISTTSNLIFPPTGKCSSNIEPSQLSTPNSNFVYNKTNTIPTVTDINKYLGSNLGGSIITITGNDLINTTDVIVGGNTALDMVINSNSSVTFTTPPGNVGKVEIELVSKSSSAKLINKFAYTNAPQDLFGYLFWITKGIINTTEFVSNNDCLVNSIQTTISTDELFSWNDQPDSFKFDIEWNNILQIVSDLNSNSDSILKGEFYTANNLKYLQFDSSLNITHKSPCVEILWNWSMTNPGCVNTLNDKSGWECIPCSNNCCSGVCSSDKSDYDVLSKCGSFYKTQYIGQKNCSTPISSNKLLEKTSLTEPTDLPSIQVTRNPSGLICETILKPITECECVNRNGDGRNPTNSPTNRWNKDDQWYWNDYFARCCIIDPENKPVEVIQSTTECECDLKNTYTGQVLGKDQAGNITIKYNGNRAFWAGYEQCVVLPPEPVDCTAPPYTIVFYITWVEENYESVWWNYSNSQSIKGNWWQGGGSKAIYDATAEAELATLKSGWESLSFSEGENDGAYGGKLTWTYKFAEVARIQVEYCGVFLRGGVFQFTIPAGFERIDYGGGEIYCSEQNSISISIPETNGFYRNSLGTMPDYGECCTLPNTNVEPIPSTGGESTDLHPC